jgi:hypothetical protein
MKQGPTPMYLLDEIICRGGNRREAVNGFRERTFVSLSRTIERIQTRIKREIYRLRGAHPFNPLQKSVDSVPLLISNSF